MEFESDFRLMTLGLQAIQIFENREIFSWYCPYLNLYAIQLRLVWLASTKRWVMLLSLVQLLMKQSNQHGIFPIMESYLLVLGKLQVTVLSSCSSSADVPSLASQKAFVTQSVFKIWCHFSWDAQKHWASWVNLVGRKAVFSWEYLVLGFPKCIPFFAFILRELKEGLLCSFPSDSSPDSRGKGLTILY